VLKNELVVGLSDYNISLFDLNRPDEPSMVFNPELRHRGRLSKVKFSNLDSDPVL
jgi:hypothetical protein